MTATDLGPWINALWQQVQKSTTVNIFFGVSPAGVGWKAHAVEPYEFNEVAYENNLLIYINAQHVQWGVWFYQDQQTWTARVWDGTSFNNIALADLPQLHYHSCFN